MMSNNVLIESTKTLGSASRGLAWPPSPLLAEMVLYSGAQRSTASAPEPNLVADVPCWRTQRHSVIMIHPVSMHTPHTFAYIRPASKDMATDGIIFVSHFYDCSSHLDAF